MAKVDIKQYVTDQIIAQLEEGTPPWQKPWTGDATGTLFPLRHNGDAYRGINILMLWAEAHMCGYQSSRWMTFRQARELGGCVIKGQKATKTVFYGTYEREVEEAEGTSEKRQRRFAKCNNVFNADQIEGLPDEYYVRPAPPMQLGTESNADLDGFFQSTGANIITSDQPSAFYSPAKDQIHMPPIGTFYTQDGYYSVLAHELIHWVGASKRLDRLKRFATKKEYAFEELVADIVKSFICIQLGITPDFGQTAAYIESWLKALKGDNGLIFKAAAEAQKAVDYINGLVVADCDVVAA